MGRYLTTEQFIGKAILIHGHLYDYSLVEYKSSHDEVIIICKEHGIFKQKPRNHLNRHGCSNCGNNVKSTKAEFIRKSIMVHGNKYDYKMVNYINNTSKINIICHLHGEFKQTPKNHLKKHGCPECVGKNKKNTCFFIEEAKKIHGNKYDYKMVNYVNNTSKINIICHLHGEFKQTPKSHLNGCNCPKCMNVGLSNSKQFIEKSIKIHGDLYNYLLVDYNMSKTKVKIICNKHGVFRQTPAGHLNGNGCPTCKYSTGESKIANFLKENDIIFSTQYSFDDLIFKGKLFFDFAIFNNNKLKCLIEYNGSQHYEYVDFFHRKQENFENYKLRDKLKIEYCEKYKIPLLIIKYNEDIIEKINEICQP